MVKEVKLKGVLICALAALFCGYQYFIQVFPSTITQDLMVDLRMSATGVGLVSGVFFLSYVLMQIPGGQLLDRFGPKLTLSFAMAVCALGCLIFGYVDTPKGLIIARIFMGIGTAFSFIGAYSLISRWLPIKWFAFFTGFVQATCCFGAAFCQTLVTHLVKILHWSTIHIYFGLFGLFLSMMYLLFINSPKDFQKTLKHTSKISMKEMLERKEVLLMSAIILLSWVPITVVGSLWGLPFLVENYQIHPQIAAMKLTYLWIGVGLGSLMLGYSANLVRSKLSLVDISALLALGCSALMIYSPISIGQVGFVLFLLGFSAGIHPVCFDVIQEQFKPHQHGRVFGILNMAPCLSGLIFQPIISTLLVRSWHGHMIENCPHYTRGEFQNALWIVPTAAILCLSCNHLLKKIPRYSYN